MRPKGTRLPGSGVEFLREPADRSLVQAAFKGRVVAIKLVAALTVYRYWGGAARETGGRWFSPNRYRSSRTARRCLALPEENSADHVTAFRIRRGSTVLWGRAASRAGAPEFGPDAVGGGLQIYLPGRTRAKRVGRS